MLREIAPGAGPKLESCRAANEVVLSRIEELMEIQRATDAGPFKTEKVARRFGAAAYSAGFQRILDSFGKPGLPATGSMSSPGSAAGRGIAAGILQQFLTLDQLRLLYDY